MRSFALAVPVLFASTSSSFAQCPGDDLFEPNDTCDSVLIDAGFYPGLAAVDDNEDWFSVGVEPNQHVQVNVFFSELQGNIDLLLLGDCSGLGGAASFSPTGDVEVVGWVNYGSDLALATFRVERVNSPPGCSSYDMLVTVGDGPFDPVGTNYCTSTVNSTGDPAVITAYGSTSVSANNLILTAAEVPPAANAIFYYGPGQAQLPLGDGFICVGGNTFRLPVIGADGAGFLQFQPDLTDMPGGSFVAGATWNFSAWYRDTGSVPPFNLSDGVEITLTP